MLWTNSLRFIWDIKLSSRIYYPTPSIPIVGQVKGLDLPIRPTEEFSSNWQLTSSTFLPTKDETFHFRDDCTEFFRSVFLHLGVQNWIISVLNNSINHQNTQLNAEAKNQASNRYIFIFLVSPQKKILKFFKTKKRYLIFHHDQKNI